MGQSKSPVRRRRSLSRRSSRPRSRSRGRGGKSGGKSRSGSTTAGSLCFFYIIGKCKKGSECTDRHPEKQDCKAILERMQKTSCRYGVDCKREECIFKHPPERKI